MIETINSKIKCPVIPIKYHSRHNTIYVPQSQLYSASYETSKMEFLRI